MLEPQGIKIMFDLHGLSVKEVKKLLEENFAKIQQHNLGEFYLITGRGNHDNSDGSRGVLKKILPKLLKPYCQDILQVNSEIGAYKVILKPKQELNQLKDLISKFTFTEKVAIKYAKTLQQQAAKNDLEAMLALATFHLHQAVKGFDDVDEGINLLQKAKQLGSLDAYVRLGTLYHEGLIVKQQHEKAFQYFLHAAKKGHPVGQYYVAVCYLHGKGVKYKDEKAVNWMKKSADQNDAYAQDALADFYLLGKITAQNKPLGIEYKTKAAEQGLADAQIDLARCYATGYGVERDYQTAFDYYLAAAQSNKPYAVYQVGSYLLTGRVGLSPDPIKAFPWFLKAAELNDADGQAQVAYQYLFGAGTSQNFDEGIRWLLKATKQENIYGYYVTATVYLKGLGVERDGLIAYKFMRQAAEKGYVEAQYELGILLFEGKNVFNNMPKNFDEGLLWLEKAMMQGHNDAAEIVQFMFKEQRDPNIFSAMLRNKMQALLARHEITELNSKLSIVTMDGNLDNSLIIQTNPENTSQSNFSADKEKAASVITTNSSGFTFFKPAQEPDEQVENAEQSSSGNWCTIS
jgi:TPR repeat protein